MTGFATVISDASRCPTTGACGWAAWVVCDGQRAKEFGQCGPYDSIDRAEVHALVQGIRLARRLWRPTNLLVQSDSKSALREFGMKRDRNQGLYVEARYLSVLQSFPPEELDFRIMPKHVKGHTRTQDARSWVNRWCDKHAREAMREMRAAMEADDPDWDPIDTGDRF